MRVGAHPTVAAAAARQPGPATRAPAGVEQFLRPVASASSPRAAPGASGLVRTSANGTWCERHVPSTGSPSTVFGPVQPFGVRKTIIGHRGRLRLYLSLAGPGAGWARSRSTTVSRVAAIRRCTSRVVAGYTSSRLVPVALEQGSQLSVRDPGQHGGVGDLVPVQVQDRQHGTIAGRVQELVSVPAVASGPVSASPSPDQQTSRPGLSKAAPKACDQRVAEFAALMERAGGLGCDMGGDAARETRIAGTAWPSRPRRG